MFHICVSFCFNKLYVLGEVSSGWNLQVHRTKTQIKHNKLLSKLHRTLIYIYKKGSANKCLGFQTISKHHRSIFFIDHVNFLLCLNFLTVYPTEATTNVCWKDPRTQNYVFDPPKHNNTTKFLIGTSSCFSKWGIPQNHGFQSYSLVQVWMIWVSSVGAMCDVWDDLAGLPCGGINPKHRMVFGMVRRLGMEVPYLWKSGCFFFGTNLP